MRPQRTLELLEDKNFESVVLSCSSGAQEDQYYDELVDAGYIDELDARDRGLTMARVDRCRLILVASLAQLNHRAARLIARFRHRIAALICRG